MVTTPSDKIEAGTTVENFLKDITSENELSIWDGKNQIKAEEEKSELIKSGMILKVDDKKEYELVVRGDINCDAKISLTDISKLILHYNEAKGFELTGVALKSADIISEIQSTTDIILPPLHRDMHFSILPNDILNHLLLLFLLPHFFHQVF